MSLSAVDYPQQGLGIANILSTVGILFSFQSFHLRAEKKHEGPFWATETLRQVKYEDEPSEPLIRFFSLKIGP